MISPSQRPLPDYTQNSQQTDTHAPGGIRTHHLSRREAADVRLRPRGHWDRRPSNSVFFNISVLTYTHTYIHTYIYTCITRCLFQIYLLPLLTKLEWNFSVVHQLSATISNLEMCLPIRNSPSRVIFLSVT